MEKATSASQGAKSCHGKLDAMSSTTMSVPAKRCFAPSSMIQVRTKKPYRRHRSFGLMHSHGTH